MKNIKLLLVFVLFSTTVFSQTSLSPGDIAITGFTADNPDQISFVLLTDVSASTAINFTDNGWLSTGGFRVNGAGNTNEGVLEWTATSDLTCGTEITITTTTATAGTVSITDTPFGLTAAGEQILAYQGTALAPDFIFGVSFDSSGWSDATSASTSALPAPLVDGVNAISLGETDNANYGCSVTNDTALILMATVDTSNWTTSNTPIPIGGCTYSCSACSSTTTWTATGWDNGLPDLSKEVILALDYDTNDDSFSACKLAINTGVKLTVRENDFVEVQGDVTNTGELLIEDKGAFVQKNETAVFINNSTVANPVIVDKVTAPLEEWYEYTYWSSPIENVAIGDLLPTTSASRLFDFNAANFSDTQREDLNNDILVPGRDDIDDDANDWAIIPNTTPMEAGKGYSATLAPLDLAGPAGGTVGIKKSFRGSVLNTGTINITANRNDDDPSNLDNNWNLIGNPYASAVDARLFLERNTYSATNTTGVLDGAIYFWSHVTPPSATTNGNEPLNFDVNDYAILNLTANTAGERYAPDDFIPSGQGFFVSFSNDFSGSTGSGATGDVVFTNEMRVNGNNDKFFKNKIIDNKLWLNLTSDTDVFSQIAIGYVSGASRMNDGSLYDARRIFSGDSAMLFSTIENDDENEYAIQGRAPEDLTLSESIGLGITTAISAPTLYTLSIDHIQGEFMQNGTIYVRDNFMGTIHNLKESDYTFTSDVGIFKTRFDIIFNEGTLSNSDNNITEKEVSIVELENDNVRFSVNNNMTIDSVRILNLLGQEIYRFKSNKKSEVFNLSNLNRTTYIAQINLSNGRTINKKSIKR